jgi:hypothetical protein
VRAILLIVLAALTGCTIHPTSNSQVDLICQKKIKENGDLRLKCSGKRIVSFNLKW